MFPVTSLRSRRWTFTSLAGALSSRATQSPGGGGLGLLQGQDAKRARRSWGGAWETEARKARDLGGGTGETRFDA